MRGGMLRLVALVAALALVAGACDQTVVEETVVGEETIVVTDEGCTYQGPTRLTPGEVSIVVENEATDKATASLHAIRGDHSFADWAADIANEQARIDAGEPLVGPSEWAPLVAIVRSVDPGESQEMIAEIGVDTYAIACGTFTGPSWLSSADKTLAVVEGFEVTE